MRDILFISAALNAIWCLFVLVVLGAAPWFGLAGTGLYFLFALCCPKETPR